MKKARKANAKSNEELVNENLRLRQKYKEIIGCYDKMHKLCCKSLHEQGTMLTLADSQN